MKKNIILLISLFTVLAGSCNDYHKTIWDPNGSAATSLSLDKSTLSVKVNQSDTISAAVSPGNALNASVIWKSSDDTIATVSESGLVTGVAAGKAVISALTDDSALSADCEVTVVALGTACTLTSLTIAPDVVGNSANNLKFDSLQPVFDAKTVKYLYAPVKYNATKVSISAAADATATISIVGNSAPAQLGNIDAVDVALPNVGANTVTITVTAEDPSVTSVSYTIEVYKAVPVFKTKQTTMYVTGDDGALQKGIDWDPAARFTVNGNEVSDAMTGLVWSNVKLSPSSWSDSFTQLTTLAVSSAGKWRLPNIYEMRSLMNYGDERTGDWIDTKWGFSKDSLTGSFWISTHTYISAPTSFRVIQLGLGKSFAGTSGSVLAVSGSGLIPRTGYSEMPEDGVTVNPAGIVPPSTRFRKTSDGYCVIDNMTGLEWLATASLNTVTSGTWETMIANAYSSYNNTSASSTVNGGFSDWRVANITELETLKDYGASTSVSLLTSFGFKIISGYNYWSSTTRPYDSRYSDKTSSDSSSSGLLCAWFTSFGGLEINLDWKSSSSGHLILPVRGFSEKE